jgi:CO/xanthine dehydrogenase Mo-binding subunit
VTLAKRALCSEPGMNDPQPTAPASPSLQPRGFSIDRSDGRPLRPGSLHTNPMLSKWLSLAQPGVIRVFTGKVELGQGILIALQLIVAEELDMPLHAVHVTPASTVRGPDEGVTSGSLSVQDSGGALRHACAELRGMALQRASASSGHASGSLRVMDGVVHSADGTRLGAYGQFLSDADLDVEFSGRWAPKSAAQRHMLGSAEPPRLDLADKVFGQARFIHDLRLPGMLHGRVLRGPGLGAKLVGWPPAAAQALAPQVRCWADGQWVAVVAPSELEVDAAAARVKASLVWQAGPPLPDPQALTTFLQSAPHDSTVTAQRGEAELPASGRRFSARYVKPYLAHASIGPSCAIARWDGMQLEVWTHSQGIHNLRDDLVLALAREQAPVPRDAIVIHHVEGAGCYGHNGADDVTLDAVLMALACPGQAVRVLWSRADELRHSPFGAAQVVELQAHVDAAGMLTHWQHELWANGYSSRPGRAKVPTLLAASERADAAALPLPINPPLASGGGADRNAVPAYRVPNLRVINNRLTVMPLRTSAIRALGAFANVFAIESFVDEMALALGEDPLTFRRKHLDDPRALAVLDQVVARSSWWRSRHEAAEGVGLGLAWARYKNTGAWCAVLARVQVEAEVRVLNLDLVVDVGLVVDLDGVINQIEGGAIQATSWTLKEQVRFDRKGLLVDGWESYPVLRFTEVPEVRVHVIDRPDEPSLGAGEAAQGPVAGAIANAVSDALGVRVRSLPLDAEQLLRAVHAAEG